MSDIYSAVYEALDCAVATNRCLASSEAQIQRALTHFRDPAADREAKEQLERMSIALHQLSLASLLNNQEERAAAVESLRESAASWMHRLPIHRPI